MSTERLTPEQRALLDETAALLRRALLDFPEYGRTLCVRTQRKAKNVTDLAIREGMRT